MATNAELAALVAQLKEENKALRESEEQQKADIDALSQRLSAQVRQSNIRSTELGDLYRPDPVEPRPDTIELTPAEIARSKMQERIGEMGLLPSDPGMGIAQGQYIQALEAEAASGLTAREVAAQLMADATEE